jgi:integrase
MKSAAVYLVSNGDYWRAEWRTAGGAKRGRSIGSKKKFSERKANEACRKLQNEINSQRELSDAPTLEQWLTFYVESRRDVARLTRVSYLNCAAYLKGYFGPDIPIDTITTANAAEWASAMASGELTNLLEAARDPKVKLSPYRPPGLRTCRNHIRVAKQIFHSAVDQDRLGANPFRHLKGSIPRVSRQWREVSTEDLASILKACMDDRWRTLFRLCYYVGLRLGEALGLEWGDLDLEANRIRVHARLELETTKARKRVVPIEPAKCPSGMLDALRVLPRVGDGPCSGLAGNGFRKRVRRILDKSIGRYEKPFHTLRKCCETRWASHYPQHVVSEWMGHAIAVSASHYLRVPEELYEAPIGGKLEANETKNGDNREIGGR